jgi:hypothetical protein
MEKTYHLDQLEQTMLTQIDQERTQALAMVGALSLDMEQARKNLDTAAERQRAFIRQALGTRGVDGYTNATARNGALVVTLPDSPSPSPVVERGPQSIDRVNGSPDVVRE